VNLAARYEARDVIDAIDCALLPGLVDAHIHTPLAIIRVVAQGVAHQMHLAMASASQLTLHTGAWRCCPP